MNNNMSNNTSNTVSRTTLLRILVESLAVGTSGAILMAVASALYTAVGG